LFSLSFLEDQPDLDLTQLRFSLCPCRGGVKHNDVTSVVESLDRRLPSML
jgi:hypothetical protein